MQKQNMAEGLSLGQEYLFDCVVSELEWRFLHRSKEWRWCSCSMCFVDVEWEPVEWSEPELPLWEYPEG